MKKSILVLGFVLGLSLTSSLNAQITVRSGSIKFTLGNNTLTFKEKMDALDSPLRDRLVLPPPINRTEIIIDGGDNRLCLGAPAKRLSEIHVTNFFDYGGGVSSISDSRYKTNIVDLVSALDKIMQLRPVRFDYRMEKNGVVDSMRMNRMGLIAQELETVLPESVRYLKEADIYMVDYVSLIPLLIKTAQEQQALIEDLQAQVEELQTLVLSSDVTTASARHQNSRETSTTVGASTQDAPAAAAPAATINENKLWSNTPNPFKQETHIRYALTNNVQNAQLCIYNLTGEQIACHRLSERGQNDFTLRAGSLRPGIYLYSLIADGEVIDTHRMVVTE